MIDAVTAAVELMTLDLQRMDVIAQNLANVGTAGFKRAVSVARPFASFLGVRGPNAGVQVVPVNLPRGGLVHDMRAGTLRPSGNPLDLAIEGNGFFEVRAPEGAQFTRHGSFRLDGAGRLTTEGGFAVMGTDGGDLMLGTDNPVIDRQGRVFEGERQMGQVRVVHFADPQTLVALGGGMYAAGEGASVQANGVAEIRQGYVEASNVSSMTEMVRMIETVRRFESGQKVIQAHDDLLGAVLNRLGEF